MGTVIYRTRTGRPETINGERWTKKVFSSRRGEFEPLIKHGLLLRDEPPIYMSIAQETLSIGKVIRGGDLSAYLAQGPAADYLGVTISEATVGEIIYYLNHGIISIEGGELDLSPAHTRIGVAPGGKIAPFVDKDLSIIATLGKDHAFDNSVWVTGHDPHPPRVRTALDDSNARNLNVTYHMLDENDVYVTEMVKIRTPNSSLPNFGLKNCKRFLALQLDTPPGAITQTILIENEDGDVCASITYDGAQVGWYGVVQNAAAAPQDCFGHRIFITSDQVVDAPVVIFGTDGMGEIQSEIISSIGNQGIYTALGYKTFIRLLTGGDDLTGEEFTVIVEKSSISIGKVIDIINSGEKGLIEVDKDFLRIVPVQGDMKPSVKVATTSTLSGDYDNGVGGNGATLTASAPASFPDMDGISVEVGNRILVKNASDAKYNGIYNLTVEGNGSVPWVLTRAEDANDNTKVTSGLSVYVEQGTVNGGDYIILVSLEISLGTTGLVFDVLSTAGGALGEVNTASNLGAAEGVFAQKSALDLEFKSLKEGSNITITSDANEITLSSWGGGVPNVQLDETAEENMSNATYENVLGMIYTIIDAGNYMILFSSSGRGSAEAQRMEYGIFINGTIEQHTHRNLDWASGADADDMFQTMGTQGVFALSGGDEVTIKWKTNIGTFYVEERSLILLRI